MNPNQSSKLRQTHSWTLIHRLSQQPYPRPTDKECSDEPGCQQEQRPAIGGRRCEWYREQFRSFIPRTVCCTCRPALSSVTTHWTSSPAISERRIHIMFIRLMARRRFCTIRDAWRGARGRKAKRPRTPVWISLSHGTARSRLFMFTSTRHPHNARAEPSHRFWHVRDMYGYGVISEVPVLRFCRLAIHRTGSFP
jgi:hypothetical protein